MKAIDYKVKFPHGVGMYTRVEFIKVFGDRIENSGKVYDSLSTKKVKEKEK